MFPLVFWPVPSGADPDLYRFFADLPDVLRLTMVLHYLEGWDVKDVARIQGIPVGTVKSRLRRGRERMKANEYVKEVLGV